MPESRCNARTLKAVRFMSTSCRLRRAALFGARVLVTGVMSQWPQSPKRVPLSPVFQFVCTSIFWGTHRSSRHGRAVPRTRSTRRRRHDTCCGSTSSVQRSNNYSGHERGACEAAATTAASIVAAAAAALITTAGVAALASHRQLQLDHHQLQQLPSCGRRAVNGGTVPSAQSSLPQRRPL